MKTGLVILLIAVLLTGCKSAAPQPTVTPTAVLATETATETAAPTTEEPGVVPTRPPTAVRTTGAPPQTEASETPGAQPQPTTGATKRPSSTPRPVSTYVFPTDESGFPMYPTDAEGNEYFPTDPAGNPMVATDESGFPIFPIDTEGNFLIPKNPQGTPLYATDEFGFPIIEVTEETQPTDEFPTEEIPTEETAQPGTGVTATVRPGGNPTARPTTARSPVAALPTTAPGGLLERTPITWATPVTNQPLGTEENPLYLGLVVTREDDLVRADAMDALAERLSQDTGLVIRTRRTGSYAELLNGMRAGGVHIAWLQPFTYIVAHQRGYADVVLVTNHFGLEAYGTMFLANASSEATTYFNPNTNTSTGTAAEALAQFVDQKPCWVDPMSASGYVVPAGLLAQNNVPTGDPVFLNSHAAVVRALYITGICDFGATFGIMGDPRTAAVIQQSLPDVMDKVKVVWQSDPVIPMLNLSVQSRLSEDLRVKIIEALVDLVQTDEGKQMLTDANAYDIRGLKEVDDKFYQPLRDLLNKSGVNSRTLLGK